MVNRECGIGVSVHRTLQIILFTTKDAKASKKIWGEMPGPHTILAFCFFLVSYRSYRLQAQKDFFTTKDTKELQNKAPDPVPQPYDIEVNEQPYLYAGKFHICKKLRLINGRNPFHAFQLHDKRVLHENIHPIPAIDLNSSIMYRKRPLQSKCNSAQTEFVSQALLVGRLQQSWAQVTMNLDCAPDHSVRQLIKFHLRALRDLRGERLRIGNGN